MRSAAISRSSARTSASPSALRAASRPIALRWISSSSGVSSIRISRSSAGFRAAGVEERRLAGRGAARDQQFAPGLDRSAQRLAHLGGLHRDKRPFAVEVDRAGAGRFESAAAS
jgi:hypothetical protein